MHTKILEDVSGFITDNASYIYSVAFRLTADYDRADELSQKTMVKAWMKRNQLKNMDAVKAWMKRICINEFLMEERKKNASEYSISELKLPEGMSETNVFIDCSPSAEDELACEQTVREIRDGCFLSMATRLPLGQRISFSLIDMFGMNSREVALVLNTTEAAVKSLLHRARANLVSFFYKKCEWVQPEGMCRCASWKEFSMDKQSLKNELARRRLSQTFSGKPAEPSFSEVQQQKIVSIYKSIPERKPPESWYQTVIEELSK